MKHLKCICAGMVALAMSAPMALAADSLKDGFEYKSLQELQAKWSISGSGFSKPIEVKQTTANVKEGRKAVQITLPASVNAGSPRIDLDIYPAIPLKDVKQIIFWVYIENPQDIVQTGIHCGNADWSDHFAKFGYTSNVKGWQRVLLTTDSLVVGSGKPTWETVNQMRITMWFARGSKPTKIIFDDVIWSTKMERDQRLNKKWYE